MKRLLRRVLGLAPRDGQGAVVWKKKAAEAAARAKALDAEVREQRQRAERFKVAVEKVQDRSAEMDALQKRLKEAERDLAVAREHLMAIEVKLDILEGAANVLDLRTRAVIARQPDQTGARG